MLTTPIRDYRSLEIQLRFQYSIVTDGIGTRVSSIDIIIRTHHIAEKYQILS